MWPSRAAISRRAVMTNSSTLAVHTNPTHHLHSFPPFGFPEKRQPSNIINAINNSCTHQKSTDKPLEYQTLSPCHLFLYRWRSGEQPPKWFMTGITNSKYAIVCILKRKSHWKRLWNSWKKTCLLIPRKFTSQSSFIRMALRYELLL